MTNIIDIELHKPHISIDVENGNVHVIPMQFFHDVVSGKRKITELEESELILKAIIKDWIDFNLTG